MQGRPSSPNGLRRGMSGREKPACLAEALETRMVSEPFGTSLEAKIKYSFDRLRASNLLGNKIEYVQETFGAKKSET